ncbi:MAG TPA: hypothetical protein GXZ82_03420 [Firmicutes bacterium]|jgi:hypothetical protein|nr:hypothetical protein [Bacillota bacterium]
MFKGRRLVLGLGFLVLLGIAFWLGTMQSERVSPGANVVRDIRIEIGEKPASGEIAGDFVVVVDLLNPGKSDLKQIKVICQQVSSSKQTVIDEEPMIISKQLTVANLPAGERVTLRFPGFTAQEPDKRQEIMVTIVGYNGMGKLPYTTAAASQSTL